MEVSLKNFLRKVQALLPFCGCASVSRLVSVLLHHGRAALHGVHGGTAIFVPQVDCFGYDGVRVLLRYLRGEASVRRDTMTGSFAPLTHIAQKSTHCFRTAQAHQHNLVAEEDFQGHEHENLAGAADHFVPHSEKKELVRF